jgi:hypothetical protein
LRLEPELLQRIDTARGSETRTAWIERALRAALDGPLEPVAPPARGSVPAARSDRVQRGRKAAEGQAPDLPKIAPRHWAR